MILFADSATVCRQSVKLVVFDVDGTLYRQQPVRLRMAWELICNAIRIHSLRTIKVIRVYRKLREALGDKDENYNEAQLIRKTSLRTGISETIVKGIVLDWIEIRPLKYLAAAVFPDVHAFCAALRQQGILVGILSDYPATSKLHILRIEADYIVSPDVSALTHLKPDPSGLRMIMQMAGASPALTVMIGDRVDRDGEASRRAGTKALILCEEQISGWRCFSRYGELMEKLKCGVDIGSL